MDQRLSALWNRAEFATMAELTKFSEAFCADNWTDAEARNLMVQSAEVNAKLARRAEAVTLRLATERANARTAELLS